MARITMREAISQALWEEMERDESVFIMGEEVGVWGGTYAVTKGFYDHFGEKRVRDTPIAEAVIVGAAIGAALTGLRPVAELMTINFAFAAMDHIVNEAAKCLEDSIIADPVVGDIGLVFGTGFAPFRGGPFRYLDQAGVAQYVDKMNRLADTYGPQFEPCQILKDHAASGKKFHTN